MKVFQTCTNSANKIINLGNSRWQIHDNGRSQANYHSSKILVGIPISTLLFGHQSSVGFSEIVEIKNK